MTEIRIQQKESYSHTIFMVGIDGTAFPEDNYQIAKEWLEAGLLREDSSKLMKEIAKLRGE